MKKERYFIIGTILIFFLGTSTSFSKSVRLGTINTEVLQPGVANPIGVWKCKIEGAKPGYENGTLFVNKEKDSYRIEVQLSNGTLTGQDIFVEEDSIKFMVNIEGMERVSIVLKIMEDTILGEAYATEGSYIIKGTRQIPSQN